MHDRAVVCAFVGIRSNVVQCFCTNDAYLVGAQERDPWSLQVHKVPGRGGCQAGNFSVWAIPSHKVGHVLGIAVLVGALMSTTLWLTRTWDMMTVKLDSPGRDANDVNVLLR